jgi:hypothetical protein
MIHLIRFGASFWKRSDSSELTVLTIGSSQSITASLVGLAWSLWTEVGVSGWTRRHEGWGVDLESLIVLTAALGDTDPRLRDESTDWCIQFGRFVSAIRLRALVRLLDPASRAAFDEYAGTVKAHAPVNWHASAPPRPYQPTGRSRLERLDRPSLFAMRLRAIFGTSARAEVVRVLTTEPQRVCTTAEMAEDAGFTRRAIEQELEGLVLSGVVGRSSAHGRRLYRIARPDVLLPFLGSRPVFQPMWAPLVRVVLQGRHLIDRAEPLALIVKAVEARKFIDTARMDIERSNLTVPDDSKVGAAIWSEVESWLVRVSTALEAGDRRVFATHAELASDPRRPATDCLCST